MPCVVADDLSKISIHALREEGDHKAAQPHTPPGYFYPRPPRGGRQATYSPSFDHSRFLSTPSARRATIQLVSLM